MTQDFDKREQKRKDKELISIIKKCDYKSFCYLYNHIEFSAILIEKAYCEACRSGSLDIVKHILKDKKYNVDPNCFNNEAFIGACSMGNLEIVRYLLTSSDLKYHCELNSGKLSGLSLACERNHVNVVHFLLTEPSLKDKLNIHFNNDRAFKEAVRNNSFSCLELLIFEGNVKKTESIQNFLASGIVETTTHQEIEKMFQKRDLKLQLENSFEKLMHDGNKNKI